LKEHCKKAAAIFVSRVDARVFPNIPENTNYFGTIFREVLQRLKKDGSFIGRDQTMKKMKGTQLKVAEGTK